MSSRKPAPWKDGLLVGARKKPYPMDCEPMVVSADRALAMEIIALVR
jgi:hypothetical protein